MAVRPQTQRPTQRRVSIEARPHQFVGLVSVRSDLTTSWPPANLTDIFTTPLSTPDQSDLDTNSQIFQFYRTCNADVSNTRAGMLSTMRRSNRTRSCSARPSTYSSLKGACKNVTTTPQSTLERPTCRDIVVVWKAASEPTKTPSELGKEQRQHQKRKQNNKSNAIQPGLTFNSNS
jgi:hypothetical protein